MIESMRDAADEETPTRDNREEMGLTDMERAKSPLNNNFLKPIHTHTLTFPTHAAHTNRVVPPHQRHTPWPHFKQQ